VAKRLSVCFAIIALLSPLFARLTFAQVDPEKALIGKWDGQAQTNQNRERTLVITSVKATGSGEWVGSGKFGPTGQEGNDTEINISSKNNEIYLEWVGAQGKAPVRVKMVGGDKLEGTIEAFDRGRVVPRGITFEKVKAGEVK
jgi:hypothetical protein